VPIVTGTGGQKTSAQVPSVATAEPVANKTPAAFGKFVYNSMVTVPLPAAFETKNTPAPHIELTEGTKDCAKPV
jgi:hypothetical protein